MCPHLFVVQISIHRNLMVRFLWIFVHKFPIPTLYLWLTALRFDPPLPLPLLSAWWLNIKNSLKIPPLLRTSGNWTQWVSLKIQDSTQLKQTDQLTLNTTVVTWLHPPKKLQMTNTLSKGKLLVIWMMTRDTRRKKSSSSPILTPSWKKFVSSCQGWRRTWEKGRGK